MRHLPHHHTKSVCGCTCAPKLPAPPTSQQGEDLEPRSRRESASITNNLQCSDTHPSYTRLLLTSSPQALLVCLWNLQPVLSLGRQSTLTPRHTETAALSNHLCQHCGCCCLGTLRLNDPHQHCPGAFAHAAFFIWDPPPSVVWPTPAPRCRPELAHPAFCTGVLPHSQLMAGCEVPERPELHWQVAQGAVTACSCTCTGTKLPVALHLLSTVALAPGKAPEDAPATSSKHAGEHGIQGPSSLSRCILEPNLTLDSLSLCGR